MAALTALSLAAAAVAAAPAAPTGKPNVVMIVIDGEAYCDFIVSSHHRQLA
jgi:hypothetical protein